MTTCYSTLDNRIAKEHIMFEFKIPEVGENIESGNVVAITVSVGDAVKKDQDLLELETDKASIPVPSPCDGVIKEILIKEGDDVKIGQLAMKIDANADVSATVDQKSSAPATDQPEQPIIQEIKEETPVAVSKPAPAKASAPHTLNSEDIPAQVDVPASPSVRRFAREIGIRLSDVPGSGPGGRISKDNVKAYAKQLLTSGAVGVPGATMAARPLPDFSKWGSVNRQAMNNIRKKTGQHLNYCWNTIPHVTQFDQADITELEKLRKRHSTKERKLTVTPFLMKVMAAALKEFPQFNASIDTATNEIIYKQFIHLGVAVDTDRGLLVPIIRDVDKKGIFELTDDLNAAAERARTKKTGLDELQGGSMTITNLGGIGGTSFTPIVNWPEVAILGVSRGGWQPRYENGHFIPRFMLPLALSYDHRIIDGADGARFLRWVVEAIEHPFMMDLK